MRHEINPVLLDMAEWRLKGDAEKTAFVPTDPAAAGAPPMDPMAGGGGMPPMDPMAAGGMPPMDPMAAAGGMPPAPPAAAPPAVPPVDPAAAGATPGAKPKIDPTFIYMELSRVRKLLTHMMQNTGIDLPPDILDDGAVAQQLNGTPHDSAPLGQEGGAPPAGPQGLPGIGGEAPINPISPIDVPGGEKQSIDVMSLFKGPVARPDDKPDFKQLSNRLDAIAAMSRSQANNG